MEGNDYARLQAEMEMLKTELREGGEALGFALEEANGLRGVVLELMRDVTHYHRLPFGPGDHACARCFPGDELLMAGFVCTYHAALDVVHAEALGIIPAAALLPAPDLPTSYATRSTAMEVLSQSTALISRLPRPDRDWVISMLAKFAPGDERVLAATDRAERAEAETSLALGAIAGLDERARAAEARAATAREEADALRGALTPGDHERAEDEDESVQICRECGDGYTLRDGCDPSPECDRCAHVVLERARALLPTPEAKS